MVKIAQFWKSTSFSPKLLSLKFIAECPRWLISLKCLVYFHEYAEFDKIWSSKLTFISTETETANRTEPQYSQSETGLNRFGILQFFGHPTGRVWLTSVLENCQVAQYVFVVSF